MNYSDLFYDLGHKEKEVLIHQDNMNRLSNEIKDIQAALLKAPELHDILTNIGVAHEGKLYIKKEVNGSWELEITEYIEPVSAYSIDSKITPLKEVA